MTKKFLESFRNKYILKEQVKLVENTKIILTDSDITHTPKYFITNTVTNFEILEHNDNSSNYENNADLIITLIAKYVNHSVYTRYRSKNLEKYTTKLSRLLKQIRKKYLRKVLNFDASKTFQDTDIPTKFLK